ncbi:MAG: hypothetical protein U0798_03420 [Gemmataceae bacterium]
MNTATAQLVHRGTVSQSKEDRCRLAGTRKRVSVFAALILSPKAIRRNLCFQTLDNGAFVCTRNAVFLRVLIVQKNRQADWQQTPLRINGRNHAA